MWIKSSTALCEKTLFFRRNGVWIKSSIALCEKKLYFSLCFRSGRHSGLGRSWGELGRPGSDLGAIQGELGRAGATWSELERPGPSRGDLGAIQGELGRSRAQEIKEPYTYTLIGSALQGNSR